MKMSKAPFRVLEASGGGEAQSRCRFSNYLVAAAFLALISACCGSSAFADFRCDKLLASDGAAGDNFGSSVSVWGDTAIIGAPYDDDKGGSSGSAYIYRFDGSNWVQQAKLVPADGTAGDNFGQSVNVWGDAVIIGAVGDDDKATDAGSAYIFRFNGSSWIKQAKLLAPDGGASNYFGQSVAICGDTAVVGAYYDNDLGIASGSAYIFRFNGSTWVYQAKLLPSDGGPGSYFGYSVDISGDTAVIGAYGDNQSGISAGSAYIFRFITSSWVEQAKLLASDGEAGDYFGYSVGISGDAAVVGAYLEDDGNDTGSAYVFRFSDSNWIQQAKLVASDSQDRDYFGRSVAIDGNTAVIGAFGDGSGGGSAGSAYIFDFNGSTWAGQAKLLAPDGADYDMFGASVGISGDFALIGAFLDDDKGDSSGSAYVFDLGINAGDLYTDGNVDFKDYDVLAAYWMRSDCDPFGCDRADFNGDGRIDYRDLNKLCSNWLDEPTASASTSFPN